LRDKIKRHTENQIKEKMQEFGNAIAAKRGKS